jgi:antitoxin (DNA-binding transcriptional repressor) of toxin-antitoxin stability system
MSVHLATIRELRTNFRSVKRKIEEYGEITITDRGEPAFLIKSLPKKSKKSPRQIDYYQRLTEYHPKQMSAEETQKFWEDERG